MSKQTKILFDNMDYSDFLDNYSFNEMHRAGMHQKCRILAHFDIEPIFLSASGFRELNDGTFKNVMIWPDTHIMARYCERVGLSGDISINPQIVLTDPEKRYGRFYKENQIAIISTGIQKYKSWPIEKTQELVDKLKGQYNFVQIGQDTDPEIKGILNKRNTASLREVASILYNSDLFVGGIGGLMHLARAVNCRAVITYSTAEPIILASYECNENILPLESCKLCGQNLRDPQHEVCENDYNCVKNIEVEDVINAIHKQMNRVKQGHPLGAQMLNLHTDKAKWIKDYYAMLRTKYYADAIVKKIRKVSLLKKIIAKLKKIKLLYIFYRILKKINERGSSSILTIEITGGFD